MIKGPYVYAYVTVTTCGYPYCASVIGEIIPFAAICCILRIARSFSVSANLTTIDDDAP